jgi:hypothetical protein
MNDTTSPPAGPPAPKAAERRASPRQACLLQATGFDGLLPLWPLTVSDLSTGGLRVALPRPVEVGAQILLSLRSLPGCPVLVACRVVWAAPHEGGWTAGCQFDQPLSQQQVDELT